MRSFSSSVVVVVATVLCCLVVSVSAHGWLSTPPSRQDQCHSGLVKNCGQVQYEPQSVEALKGKMSCNGDVPLWAPLADESKAWVVTPVGSGINTFAWTQTAIHVAANWEYYIGTTKIATFLGTANTVHCVDLSGYTGRQKILAVWNVGDTVNAFYSCVDVNIGAGVGSGSSCVGGGATVFTPVTNTGCTTTTQQNSYVVAAGDTLTSIAAAKGTTVAEILVVNPYLTNPDLIEVGSSIILPLQSTQTCGGAAAGAVTSSSSSSSSSSTGGSRSTTSSSSSSSGAAAPSCTSGFQSYSVKSGDTIGSIAAAKGLTAAQVVAANAQLVRAGTTLILPTGVKTSCAAGCSTKASTSTYTVLSGDTMDKIAAAKGITLTGLASANPQITDITLINIGQVLNIPTYATTCT